MWPEQLRQKLQAKYRSPLTIQNRAVAGSTLKQTLERMAPWLEQPPGPDLVTICFGFNDWSGGARGEQFEATYREAVDRIRRATNGKADILIMTTVPAVARWTTMAELAEAGRRVARECKVGLADTEKAFLPAGRENKEQLFSGDRLHLSAAGQELVARTVLAALEQENRSEP